MPKPDLSRFSPQIREAIIARRAERLAERGKPAEIWDTTNARLVDREQFIAEAVAKGVAQALNSSSIRGGVITEVAPRSDSLVQEGAPGSLASVPARPYHEMSSAEFREAAGDHLDRIFGAHPAYEQTSELATTETARAQAALAEARATAWANLLSPARSRRTSPFWSAGMHDTEGDSNQ